MVAKKVKHSTLNHILAGFILTYRVSSQVIKIHDGIKQASVKFTTFS
jgi:hypothetical protein